MRARTTTQGYAHGRDDALASLDEEIRRQAGRAYASLALEDETARAAALDAALQRLEATGPRCVPSPPLQAAAGSLRLPRADSLLTPVRRACPPSAACAQESLGARRVRVPGGGGRLPRLHAVRRRGLRRAGARVRALRR